MIKKLRAENERLKREREEMGRQKAAQDGRLQAMEQSILDLN